jgi:hypothetical protein
MKDLKKSDLRMLRAMQLTYELCSEGSEINMRQIATVHKITNAFSTVLTRAGLVVRINRKKYEWIGPEPSLELIQKVRSETAIKKNDDSEIEEPQNEENEFENKTIDEKINHLEFMLDQIFERVNYLFET